MPSLSGLASPASIVNGMRQSLLGARGANPRATMTPGSFDRQLQYALESSTAAPVLSGVGIGIGTPLGTSAESVTESLRTEREAALARFEVRFRRLLSEKNIDVGDGVVLAKTAGGGVQVVGDHPHKHAIEQLFSHDPELLAQFSHLEAQAMFASSPVSPLMADAQPPFHPPGNFSLIVGRDSMSVKYS